MIDHERANAEARRDAEPRGNAPGDLAIRTDKIRMIRPKARERAVINPNIMRDDIR
jgi:hypothetical protein